MPRLSMLAPFRVRSFRFQWPSDLLTSWAFEMEVLILGWYVLVETGSVLFLTVFGALQYGGTLIAPILGVASDRIGHRNLLSGMRAVYASIAATITVLAFTGALTPLLVCVLAALMGLVRPSDMGIRGALTAETMPFGLLTAAMGFSRSTSDSARIAGALAGAGLFAAFGMGPAYIVITAFYILGALLTLGVGQTSAACPRPPAAAAVSGSVSTSASTSTSTSASTSASTRVSPWRDLREGFAHVWNTPRLLATVWLALLFNLSVFSITNGLLPYVARDVYHIDQTGLGYLVASCAFGALIGSIVLSSMGVARHLPRLMIASAVVWHILLLIFAQMQSLPGGLVSLMLVGFMQSLTMVSHTVILLHAAEQHLRGRVMGVRMLAIYSLPLGLLAAGVLIGLIGFRATISLYAVIGLAFTVLIAVHFRASLWRQRVATDAS